uniref:Angiotensin-converting enzyme n=1 Tax=Timema tahoe TaxID=61484 RepID=A0A7R9IDF6_9NEOP|nr:unnamed protein product [Timema tahoe]
MVHPRRQYSLSSRDPAELKHAWVEWRKESGEKCRSLFEHYVALSNEAAILNKGAAMLNCIYREPCLCDVDFTDTTEYWLMDYESPDFQKQVLRLWEQIEPLYKELHAYVRRKLRETYGEEIVSRNGPIPAHLLGNMWAQKWGNVLELSVPYPNASAVDVTPKMKEQTWGNVLDISTPYPEKEAVDVTPQMVKKGYTPLRMFKLAEEFFISLNLSAMPASFWDNSILEKPKDRDLVCHASAIKQCTRVDMNDLLTAHHEMGHIQYYIQYKHQPKIYKRGANPGFHEAVGDVMSLSVSTPKHLRKVGLLDANSVDDYEATINYLYLQGLQKVAFLPSALLMDLWRWDVFKGHTTSDRYNCDWWKLREKYQGVEPATHRTEDNFDPGAKYHIIASVPYIRYFVSYVIQFQFHRSLCEKAGQFDPEDPESKPLHECDIYQSTEAGNLLGVSADKQQGMLATQEIKVLVTARVSADKQQGMLTIQEVKVLVTARVSADKQQGMLATQEVKVLVTARVSADKQQGMLATQEVKVLVTARVSADKQQGVPATQEVKLLVTARVSADKQQGMLAIQEVKVLVTARVSADKQQGVLVTQEVKVLLTARVNADKYQGVLASQEIKMGSSRPWPDAMEVVTGQREMDASGLLDYFSPLYKWLQDENNRTEEYIGWEPSNKVCVQNQDELAKILENVSESSTEE